MFTSLKWIVTASKGNPLPFFSKYLLFAGDLYQHCLILTTGAATVGIKPFTPAVLIPCCIQGWGCLTLTVLLSSSSAFQLSLWSDDFCQSLVCDYCFVMYDADWHWLLCVCGRLSSRPHDVFTNGSLSAPVTSQRTGCALQHPTFTLSAALGETSFGCNMGAWIQSHIIQNNLLTA